MRFVTPLVLCLAVGQAGGAADLDAVGVSALRVAVPSLTGAGVMLAQPEAGLPTWQVSPAAVGQPQALFRWISSNGTATVFPNGLGAESGHANAVGNRFYGAVNGAAPGAAGVDNYEANYFYNAVVVDQTDIASRVVNQSFIFGGQNLVVDRNYDNYAARFNVLVVSGVGNSGPPSSPATCFNGLGVGVSDAPASLGPTSDGRAKPDLAAPGGQASFSTPLVAGCAALLLQAGARDEGGAGTAAAATDCRTIKALLLNGAVKPAGWTNSTTRPLDARFGAGVVNVFEACRQLRGGRQAFTAATSVPLGGAHPPPATTDSVPARRGWDFNTLSSSLTQERVNHYFFDWRAATNRTFTLAATLVWHRQLNQTAINDLDLFLYDADTGALVAASQSGVDNVEHLFVTNLPPARYALQVWKAGGPLKRVTASETYALAFDFGPPEETRLANPTHDDGQFRARLLGEPGTEYVIQATTNLSDWFPVWTNRPGAAGFFDFADPGATNGQRVYRAKRSL